MERMKTTTLMLLFLTLATMNSIAQERDYEGAMLNAITMMNSVSGME
jgi:hypothetical protein